MIDSNCHLCGCKNVSVLDTSPCPDMSEVDCPNCGEYSIAGLEALNIPCLTPEKKTQLRAVVKERSAKDIPAIILPQSQAGHPSGTTIADLLDEYPKTADEMINRAMLNLGRLPERPFDEIHLESSDGYLLVFASDSADLLKMVKLLKSMNYLTGTGSTTDETCVMISPKGWEKIEELKGRNPESKQAFVAMWFHETMESFWKNGFEPGIEGTGKFVAIRIDRQEHNEKICDRVIGEIRKSRFVVADFTGDRGGVYYEAGFAQGLGIPVIWSVRSDWLNKVHFDTRQYNHIVYDDPEQLRDSLRNRIAATISTPVAR